MTDLCRAMCEQLMELVEGKRYDGSAVVTRARALLAQPEPPSLKEQALEDLGPEPRPETGPTGDTILNVGAIERHRFLRRALEQLPDTH